MYENQSRFQIGVWASIMTAMVLVAILGLGLSIYKGNFALPVQPGQNASSIIRVETGASDFYQLVVVSLIGIILFGWYAIKLWQLAFTSKEQS